MSWWEFVGLAAAGGAVVAAVCWAAGAVDRWLDRREERRMQVPVGRPGDLVDDESLARLGRVRAVAPTSEPDRLDAMAAAGRRGQSAGEAMRDYRRSFAWWRPLARNLDGREHRELVLVVPPADDGRARSSAWLPVIDREGCRRLARPLELVRIEHPDRETVAQVTFEQACTWLAQRRKAPADA